MGLGIDNSLPVLFDSPPIEWLAITDINVDPLVALTVTDTGRFRKAGKEIW